MLVLHCTETDIKIESLKRAFLQGLKVLVLWGHVCAVTAGEQCRGSAYLWFAESKGCHDTACRRLAPKAT